MKQEALGRLQAKVAALRYGNPARAMRLIAVAGNTGKTTTASLIADILREADRSVMLLVNRGNEVVAGYDTNPAVLQQHLAQAKRNHTDFVIIEVTDQLVRAQVLPTLPIDTAVVVSSSFGATALLEQPLSYAVVPSGYETSELGIASHQIISFGDDETAEARINKVKLYRKGTEVNLTIDHQTTFDLATYLVGRANVYNVAAATAAAYVLSVDLETLNEGIARLDGVEGNYQYIAAHRPYAIVVDGAANDTSIDFVTASAKELTKRRLIVVLEGKHVGDTLLSDVRARADRLLLVSDSEIAIPGVEVQSRYEEAVRLALRGAKQDDTVLLIGSSFTERREQGLYAEELIGESESPAK